LLVFPLPHLLQRTLAAVTLSCPHQQISTFGFCLDFQDNRYKGLYMPHMPHLSRYRFIDIKAMPDYLTSILCEFGRLTDGSKSPRIGYRVHTSEQI
jgi:hypothetical protein